MAEPLSLPFDKNKISEKLVKVSDRRGQDIESLGIIEVGEPISPPGSYYAIIPVKYSDATYDIVGVEGDHEVWSIGRHFLDLRETPDPVRLLKNAHSMPVLQIRIESRTVKATFASLSSDRSVLVIQYDNDDAFVLECYRER